MKKTLAINPINCSALVQPPCNDFERDFSFLDEIEDIRFSAFSKEELTGVEADVRRTSD